MVNEIKLYDVGEDDEMLPDCAESDFQDLENIITKVRCSTALLSVKQLDAYFFEKNISLHIVQRFYNAVT